MDVEALVAVLAERHFRGSALAAEQFLNLPATRVAIDAMPDSLRYGSNPNAQADYLDSVAAKVAAAALRAHAQRLLQKTHHPTDGASVGMLPTGVSPDEHREVLEEAQRIAKVVRAGELPADAVERYLAAVEDAENQDPDLVLQDAVHTAKLVKYGEVPTHYLYGYAMLTFEDGVDPKTMAEEAIKLATAVRNGELEPEAFGKMLKVAHERELDPTVVAHEEERIAKLIKLGELPPRALEDFHARMRARKLAQSGTGSLSRLNPEEAATLHRLGELPTADPEARPAMRPPQRVGPARRPIPGAKSSLGKQVPPNVPAFDATEPGLAANNTAMAAESFAQSTAKQAATFSEQQNNRLEKSYARSQNAAVAFDRELNEMMTLHSLNADEKARVMQRMRAAPTMGGWATVKKYANKAIASVKGKGKGKEKDHGGHKTDHEPAAKTSTQASPFIDQAARDSIISRMKNLSLASTAGSPALGNPAPTEPTAGFVSKVKGMLSKLTTSSAHAYLMVPETEEGAIAADFAESVAIGDAAFAKHAIAMLYHLIVQKGIPPESIQSQLVSSWTRRDAEKPFQEIDKVQVGMVVKSSAMSGNFAESVHVDRFSYVRADWKVGDLAATVKTGLVTLMPNIAFPWTAFFRGLKLGDPPVWSRSQEVRVAVADETEKEKLVSGKYPLAFAQVFVLHLQESPALVEAIKAGHRTLLVAPSPMTVTDVNGQEHTIVLAVPLIDNRMKAIFCIVK